MTADQFEQNPDFRDAQYYRVWGILRNSLSEGQLRYLRTRRWTAQPEDVRRNWQVYLPEWSRPGWDPTRIVRVDGTHTRAAHPNEAVAMRPTIMPSDQEPRTDYAM